jgi:phospholipid/cholesterol/gamma-HCH transport system substrate-binding protein
MDSSNRVSDVKVGAFVLAALVVLISGSLWIAGSTLFRVRQNTYVVLMKGSAGVQAGDRVRFAGVKVGRIKSVSLAPESEWPVVVEVSLDPDIPIREDSQARISSSGLMGASFLVVEAGSPGASLLAEGGTLYGTEQPGFDEAVSHVNAIAERITRLLDQVSEVLSKVSTEIEPILSGAQALLSQDNTDRISDILATMDATLSESGPRITSLMTRLDSLAGKLETGADDIPEMTSQIKQLVVDLRSALGPDGSRIVALLESAQGTLGSADESLSILSDNREELEWAIRDLRDTAANLSELSQGLKENPSSLLWGKGEKDRRPGDGVGGTK